MTLVEARSSDKVTWRFVRGVLCAQQHDPQDMDQFVRKHIQRQNLCLASPSLNRCLYVVCRTHMLFVFWINFGDRQ